MDAYISIVKDILNNGVRKENRTGIDTIGLPSATFEHDMQTGFPLLTTKKMFQKSIKVELEGFIKGITDKSWYQERGCHIWDEWCNPKKVPYGHDEETKEKMKLEKDLGPIYGFQWRHFDAEYHGHQHNYDGKGVDQLANMINTLENNPNDRRMIVSAWNPKQINQMALPPCHLEYQAIVLDDKINLTWRQRSVDTMLGLPFNIASYGLLLHLLAKQSGFKEGKLTGFLGDTHIYENQIPGAEEQITRNPLPLPSAETKNFTSIFDWTYKDSKFINYQSHPKIEFPLAV